MNIKKISLYRRELMGVAMLLIMRYHSSFPIPSAAISNVYGHIRYFFAIGVDVFLFLSGFGLYYSYHKTPDLLGFYKKRLLRLLPSYFLIIAGWFAVSTALGIETPGSFLPKYSLISFFTNGEAAIWFIAAILLLYLVFPLLYHAIQRAPVSLLILSVLLYAISFWGILFHGEEPIEPVSRLFLVRIPSFLAGMWFSARLYDKQKPQFGRVSWCVIVLIVDLILLLMNAYYNEKLARWAERILFVPLVISAMLLLSEGFDRLSKRNHNGLLRLLALVGGCTLQTYLLHERVLLVYTTYSNWSNTAKVLMNLTAMVMAVMLAWMASRMIDACMRKLFLGKSQAPGGL